MPPAASSKSPRGGQAGSTQMPTRELQILVTGGAGFVGAATVQFIIDLHPSWNIAVVDRRTPGESCLPAELLTDQNQPRAPGRGSVRYIQCDILNSEDTEKLFREVAPDAVIHTAGVVPGGLDRYDRKNTKTVDTINVEATKIVLQAAKNVASVRAFVQTSSCTCITDDLDLEFPNFSEAVPYPSNQLKYGKSKAESEKLVLAANDFQRPFYTTALRPPAILGRHDYQVVPTIYSCMAKWESPFIVGSGDNMYDFIFIDNVAWSHVLALENLLGVPLSSQLPKYQNSSIYRAHRHSSPIQIPFQPFTESKEHGRHPSAAGLPILISNGQAVAFRDFCLAIWAQWDHVPPFTVRLPASLAYAVGYASEWVSYLTGFRATFCRGGVQDAVGTRYCDLTRAKQVLGFQPLVDLWDGIRIGCDEYKKKLELQANQESLT